MTAILHSTTVRRLIHAKRDWVFHAFTRAEALEQWFSPSPEITLDVLQFDFRAGGQYRFRYAMTDGSNPVLGGHFECIDPPSLLSFTWIWEEPDPHAGIPTRVRVEFREDESSTEVILTHSQIPAQDIADRHAAGWEATLDRLEDLAK
ncbi:SRPBCC domain-containing protein [uncultured Roseobacter sp.]|uniref:SRPBCC family protein n=1 Tax=uncultured Roseobacter sp. TaxID=114847 RepID=UPI0026194BB3|nr:SRPBCC domain-containing protein [uncultured Roseobacter sp.]